MKRWQRFYIHGSIWLITEVVLSLMGLDDLADYSEFFASARNLCCQGTHCDCGVIDNYKRFTITHLVRKIL